MSHNKCAALINHLLDPIDDRLDELRRGDFARSNGARQVDGTFLQEAVGRRERRTGLFVTQIAAQHDFGEFILQHQHHCDRVRQQCPRKLFERLLESVGPGSPLAGGAPQCKWKNSKLENRERWLHARCGWRNRGIWKTTDCTRPHNGTASRTPSIDVRHKRNNNSGIGEAYLFFNHNLGLFDTHIANEFLLCGWPCSVLLVRAFNFGILEMVEKTTANSHLIRLANFVCGACARV